MPIINKAQLAECLPYQSEPTAWHQVTQDQINQFADATLDQQFIHTDPEKARHTPFGGTIAHGFLSLSLLSHFAESFGLQIEGTYMGINYGFDKVRFLAPVKVDSRIRAHAKTVDILEKKPGQYMMKTEVTVEIEGEEKPALKADWLTMLMVK